MVTVLGLLLALLAGCGDAGPSAESNGPDAAKSCLRHLQSPRLTPSVPDKKLKSIDLTLDGYPDAENVGVLIADQRGYFAEAGFDVEVFRPTASDNVAEYVSRGFDDAGLLPQPEVAIAQDKGMPLVAIGSLVPQPTMAMITLPGSRIDGIADLAEKTVAINGFSFEERFLEALLKRAGLAMDDVTLKSVGYGLVPALVQGHADVIFGGSSNVEGAELKACAFKPRFIPLQDLGIPPYEALVMVTRRDHLAGRSSWVRPFVSAVARGTNSAVDDPQAAAGAIVFARRVLEVPYPQNSKLTTAEVEATLPLLSPTGRVSPGRATDLLAWMRKEKIVESE